MTNNCGCIEGTAAPERGYPVGAPINECCGDQPTPICPERLYDINIHEVSRGFIVQVGCQTIAIEDRETLLTNLVAYISNPAEYMKKYFSEGFKLLK